VTLSQLYTRAHGYHDILAWRVPLIAFRLGPWKPKFVVVIVAANIDKQWVGWLGEASWQANTPPTHAHGSAEARAKLANRLAVQQGNA
jgi:hypothetical protein